MVLSSRTRPLRSIDDPRPVTFSQVAFHGIRQRLADLALPRFRTNRAGVRRRLRSGELQLLPHLEHIAVVHWENLGDAVLLTGFLRELRRNAPQARISLIHNEATSNLFEHCPYVDVRLPQQVRSQGVVREEVPYFQKMRDSASRLRELGRQRPIDIVLGPDWLEPVGGRTMWENLLCHRAGAPLIVAARAAAGLDVAIDIRQHNARRTLQVLEVLGGIVADDRLELWLSDEDERLALEVVPADTGPFVALAPVASVPRRSWPPERYAEVVRRLVDEHGVRVVVLGGAVDREVSGMPELLAQDGVIDAVGKLPLRASAAVIRRAVAFVGNDSGPAHLASAVETPAFVLFGHGLDGDPWIFTSPARYGPWHNEGEALQPAHAVPPCDRGCWAPTPHCIEGITTEQVLDAVARVVPRR